jgi:hypothetical protein
MKRLLDDNDLRGVAKLVDCLMAGRPLGHRTQLRWPSCGVVPGWSVIEAPARTWLVRTPDGAERTLSDGALTELLRTTWVRPAAAAIAREQARRLLKETA